MQLKVAGASNIALAITGSVVIGSGSDGLLPTMPGNDVNFFVSGSISSSGTSTKGTTVFGGDVVISGSLKTNKEMVFNEKLGGTADGTNTLFTLANTPFSSTEISVFVNGVLQVPAGVHTFQDYSVTGSNVFFTTASIPAEDSLILSNYNKSV